MSLGPHTSPAVGIDLGTTFSAVAVYEFGKVKVLTNIHGSRITPSCVSFTPGGKLVGEEAKTRGLLNIDNTLYEVKRLMGKPIDDHFVQEDIRRWPFMVGEKDGKPVLQVHPTDNQVEYSPEEISAMILQYMKDIAEEHLQQTITEVVVTVPAYFNDNQRKATESAATIVGLKVLRMINEPTAAALAYTQGCKLATKKTVLVYDLGGGTFDVSILRLSDDMCEVLATKGDTHLGGADFDENLAKHLLGTIHSDVLETISHDDRRLFERRLRRHCEMTKCQLSTEAAAKIIIDPGKTYEEISFKVERRLFEELNERHFQRTLEIVRETLSDANIGPGDIDDVILVGGSTRIPRIREILEEYFAGRRLNTTINPDEAVAHGAAIQAAMLFDPDDMSHGERLLLDVTPLSLGTDVVGDRMSVIIPRNSHIPTQKTQTYYTVLPEQTGVRVQVYQGEHENLNDNYYLGEFVMKGLTPKDGETTAVYVTFDLDEHGMLQVKATEKDTELTMDMTICNDKMRLNPAKVRQLMERAQYYPPDDQDEIDRMKARRELQEYAEMTRDTETNENILRAARDVLNWINNESCNALLNEYTIKMRELRDAVSTYEGEGVPEID